MSAELRIEGVDRLLATFDALAKKAQADAKARLTVGYSAPYSIWVHENLQARHTAPGQAKFLESPARTEERKMAQIIADDLKAGKTMEESLLDAGQHLLTVSQQIVPVDTGKLRDSGFVRVD